MLFRLAVGEKMMKHLIIMPRIDNDPKLDFKDVLIKPKRSTLVSRSDVNLERTFSFKNSGRIWTGIPIMASNMDTTGSFEMARALAKHHMFTCIHKHYTVEEWLENIDTLNTEYIALSIGITDFDLTKLSALSDRVKFVCIDVANGYTEKFASVVATVHQNYPSLTIIAGNVVTGEMVEELILKGADVVKIGIGPGSVCVTRRQTGVGYPQLSAVIECADAAHGLGGHIISDGGCVVPGDIAKAIGGGADFCMLGGMLAAHDECGGIIRTDEETGKQYMTFYGMSSDTAMAKYNGGVAKYRSSEGKTVQIEARGPVDNTILDMLGGLRSACTYVGARKLKELAKRTTFIRVTQQLNNVFN